MNIETTSIDGLLSVVPKVFGDDRGSFAEVFRADLLAESGAVFDMVQVNQSVSRQGSLRGVHFARNWPSQAKYVVCAAGSVLDLAIDVRVGSPTEGEVVSAELTADGREALFLPEGVGHAFVALTEWATVTYLCSTPYSPGNEFGINPLDSRLGLPLPKLDYVLSDKDQQAPTWEQAREQGILPDYAALAEARSQASR